MSNRIPPSLNWLIKKRARLSGEILKIKKCLSKVQSLVELLNKKEKDLAAIDYSLSLHEIQVDLELIIPVRTKTSLGFPHGYIQNFALAYLSANAQDKPVNKTDIVQALIEEHKTIFNSTSTPKYVYFSNAVTQSLIRLYKQGFVEYQHNKITNEVGRWKLSERSD